MITCPEIRNDQISAIEPLSSGVKVNYHPENLKKACELLQARKRERPEEK